MAKTDSIHARLDPGLKQSAESILTQLGLTSSDAVNLLFRQIVINNGLPFELRLPNRASEYSREAVNEANQIMADLKSGKRKGYKSIESLKRDLENEIDD